MVDDASGDLVNFGLRTAPIDECNPRMQAMTWGVYQDTELIIDLFNVGSGLHLTYDNAAAYAEACTDDRNLSLESDLPDFDLSDEMLLTVDTSTVGVYTVTGSWTDASNSEVEVMLTINIYENELEDGPSIGTGENGATIEVFDMPPAYKINGMEYCWDPETNRLVGSKWWFTWTVEMQ